MKKTVFAILICAVMVLTAPLTALAQDYTDAENNVTFSVSDNWVRNTESESGVIKYFFSMEGKVLEYGSMDMWNEIPEDEKSGHTREEMDNSFFTKEDIEESLFSGPEYTMTSSSREEYNGYDYYVVKVDYNSSKASNVKIVAYVHFYNGYLFMFMSMGINGEEVDITDVMNTVKFNNETGSNKTETNASKTAKNVGKSVLSKSLIRGIVIAVVALLGGGGGFFARMKAKKQAQNNPEVYQPQNNVYTPAQPQENTYTPAQPQNNAYTPGAPQSNIYTPPAPDNPTNENVNTATPAGDTNNSYSNPFYNGENK